MAKKNKTGAGRPPIEIDPKMVEKLASLGCKNEEMADYFGCSTDTLERNFAGEMSKGRANVRLSLRQMQLDAARKGNATMLVWLGKQMLGQKDQIEVERSGEDTQRVIIQIPENGRAAKKE